MGPAKIKQLEGTNQRFHNNETASIKVSSTVFTDPSLAFPLSNILNPSWKC